MQGKNVRVRSSGGGEFDCYRVTPRGGAKVPAIVLASAVHGVNEDLCASDDDRTKQRSQPRLEKIKTGEADLADTLAELRKLPQSNGRAAVIGFCYGGPYAILGPK